MFLISSLTTTVLPTPAPPNIPILPPFVNGEIKSITFIPVSRISGVVFCSESFGDGLCIGAKSLSFLLISPNPSTACPNTLNILPKVFSPTGTEIGALVLTTLSPLFNPSVEPKAIVLTSKLSIWNIVSKTSLEPFFIVMLRASYTSGVSSLNLTSTTAP